MHLPNALPNRNVLAASALALVSSMGLAACGEAITTDCITSKVDVDPVSGKPTAESLDAGRHGLKQFMLYDLKQRGYDLDNLRGLHETALKIARQLSNVRTQYGDGSVAIHEITQGDTYGWRIVDDIIQTDKCKTVDIGNWAKE